MLVTQAETSAGAFVAVESIVSAAASTVVLVELCPDTLLQVVEIEPVEHYPVAEPFAGMGH